MIKLEIGEIYTFKYVKQIPSLLNNNITSEPYLSDYEYLGNSEDKYCFYDWINGKEIILTKKEVEQYIK